MAIQVLVKPNSKVESVQEVGPGDFVVKVKAPPIDGRANERVVELLAQYFGLAKSKIQLAKGLRSKHKKVIIVD